MTAVLICCLQRTTKAQLEATPGLLTALLQGVGARLDNPTSCLRSPPPFPTSHPDHLKPILQGVDAYMDPTLITVFARLLCIMPLLIVDRRTSTLEATPVVINF